MFNNYEIVGNVGDVGKAEPQEDTEDTEDAGEAKNAREVREVRNVRDKELGKGNDGAVDKGDQQDSEFGKAGDDKN